MHEKQKDDQSEFMKTVDEIRRAESAAEKIRTDAKEKADDVLKKAKETVMKIKQETSENCVQEKNKHIQKGKERIDQEVELLLSKAKAESDAVREKRLKQAHVVELFNNFLSS
ncbi:TPA: hypothetical protein HA238_02320 [Candidatus Micrarchaeota archaeon]|nr:hypothetical protein [Candidatus Micrarchaeota archaeon]